MSQSKVIVCLLGLCACWAGCSGGSGGTADGGSLDAEGGQLFPCAAPGLSCNAHDSCAINPICGDDLLCRASRRQDCDDGLSCTEDACTGLGRCEHKLKVGFCALSVSAVDGQDQQTERRCFADDERDPERPCFRCDAAHSPNRWAWANSGVCDDGDPCTNNDVCQNGSCRGEDYRGRCADAYTCTDDLCDGKGGCSGNPLKAGFCLINGVCHADQQVDASGCGVCDVGLSVSAWTWLPDRCAIDGACFVAGDQSLDHCGVCDPQANAKDWTPVSGGCQIDGSCYQAGAKNSDDGGCGTCDPATSATSWKVADGTCLIAGQCVAAGVKDADGCSRCDPATSKTAWTTESNQCAIGGKCYPAGAVHPLACAQCDPSVSADSWTVSGQFCLIDDFCYLPGVEGPSGCTVCAPSLDKSAWSAASDKCEIGGVCYQSGAANPLAACQRCDPAASKDEWSPVPDTCLIDGVCRAPGAKHPQLCAECDPSVNAEGWTVNWSYCLVDGLCYLPGSQRPGGCGQCDPATDHYHWSPSPGKCVIDGACVDAGAKSPDGCGSCDPAQSTSDWTPIAGCVPPFALAVGGSHTVVGLAAAADAAGNLYVTGRFQGQLTLGSTVLTSKGGDDLLVAKIGPTGQPVWATSAGGTGADAGRGVAVDTSGNVYITGGFSAQADFGSLSVPTNGNYDVFVAKLTPAGQFVWATAGGGALVDEGYDVAVDGGGAVYVTGGTNGGTFGSATVSTSGQRDLFVGKLSAQGQMLWVTLGGGAGPDLGQGVAVDAAGASYVAGRFNGQADFGSHALVAQGGTDMVVAKLTPQGQYVWATAGGGNSSDEAYGVAVDGAGNVLAVGGFSSSSATFGASTLSRLGSSDLFVVKLDAQGAFDWVVQGGGAGADWGAAIDVDGTGAAYIAGYFALTATFGGTKLTSQGASDVLVAKVSPQGSFVWAAAGGGSSSDLAHGVAVDGSGRVGVTGGFRGSAVFGNTTLSAVAYENLFIWNLTPP